VWVVDPASTHPLAGVSGAKLPTAKQHFRHKYISKNQTKCVSRCKIIIKHHDNGLICVIPTGYQTFKVVVALENLEMSEREPFILLS
jgi:hypothetical protein